MPDRLYKEELDRRTVDSPQGFQEFLYSGDFESGIRHSLELQSRLESMRRHYEESISQWNAAHKAVLEEIACSEETLRQKELELEKLMTADPFQYAAILQTKAECQTLQAYVKGLKFGVAPR